MRPRGSEAERTALTLDVVRSHQPVRPFAGTKHPVRYARLVEAGLVAALARHGLATPRDERSSPVAMTSFPSSAVRRGRQSAPRPPTVLMSGRFRSVPRPGMLPWWADCAGPDVRLLRQEPEPRPRRRARARDVLLDGDAPADAELRPDTGAHNLATSAPRATRERPAWTGGVEALRTWSAPPRGPRVLRRTPLPRS